MSAESDLIREQAAKIVQSGALGRSRSYGRLLEFLVECAANSRTPKELEIAIAGPIASGLLSLRFLALGGLFARGRAGALPRPV